jgi:hypothetical protein
VATSVVGREPHPGAHLGDHRLAGDGVVVAPQADEALADVVEPGPDQEEVGPGDPADEVGGAHRGLAQVPVDREAVVGVALRAAADRRPLGQHGDEQAFLVEGLDDAHGRPTRAQQGNQALAGLVRPRVAEGRRAGGGQAVQAVATQARP